MEQNHKTSFVSEPFPQSADSGPIQDFPPYPPVPAPKRDPLPAGKPELLFAFTALAAGMILCNFLLFGGFNLGFAIGVDLCILVISCYLLAKGHKLTPYSSLLLITALITGAGFARSDDGFVKFVMTCFLFVCVNLGLTLLAEKPRHNPGGVCTLCDAFYTGFVHSFGNAIPVFSGLKQTVSSQSTVFRKGSAIAKGLILAVPLVLVMIFLLMRADAAFEGLMDLLPAFNFGETFATLVFGVGTFCLVYAQGVSLQYSQDIPTKRKTRTGSSALTVNTVLICVCLVYLVYLISQIAYFIGGFAGILPVQYTMAQYARRGFFEMAWLCAINLGLVGLCIGLVKKDPSAPLLTRLLCLFVSIITVFFVATASGKMFLYMASYGLTRLRVLTQVIMLWLCLTNILVAIWLFLPRLPYMKAVIAAGLIIGALVLWVDVDGLIAQSNVRRYLSGELDGVDISYLSELNSSAVPYIAELSEAAPDPNIREAAQDVLENWYYFPAEDFRDWNYARHTALDFLPDK